MKTKFIYEDWTADNFIKHIEPMFNNVYNNFYSRIDTEAKLKKWVVNEQPFYKKEIKEVTNYFLKKKKEYENKKNN